MMLLPAEVRVLVFKSPFMNPTPSTTPPTIFETDATEAAETGREGFWAWYRVSSRSLSYLERNRGLLERLL